MSNYPKNVIMIYLCNEDKGDNRVILCEKHLFKEKNTKKILKTVFPELFDGWFWKKPINSFEVIPQEIGCSTFNGGIPSYFDDFVLRAINDDKNSNDWNKYSILSFSLSLDKTCMEVLHISEA